MPCGQHPRDNGQPISKLTFLLFLSVLRSGVLCLIVHLCYKISIKQPPLNINLSLLNIKQSLLNIKQSLLNTNLSLLNIKQSLLNINLSLLNIKQSLLNIKQSLLNTNLSLISQCVLIPLAVTDECQILM